MQPRFFIVRGLRQHAEPDGMALVRPLKGEMGTILIVGSNVLRMPGECRHTLENGLECLHIQGESWYHDGPIMCSADEFDGFPATARTLRAFITSYHELLHVVSDAVIPNPDARP